MNQLHQEACFACYLHHFILDALSFHKLHFFVRCSISISDMSLLKSDYSQFLMTHYLQRKFAKMLEMSQTIPFLVSVFSIMLVKTELIVFVLLYVTALAFFIFVTTRRSEIWYEKVKRRTQNPVKHQ